MKKCLQCGFPLKDEDLPLCPSCNLKTMQKIELERNSVQKKSHWLGIVGCCVLGVIAFVGYIAYINHSKMSEKKEALDIAVQKVKVAMQERDYSEAWKAFKKAKDIDPTCETITSLMETMQKEPLDWAQKLISQSQFDEARKILVDANKANSSPDLEKMLKNCDYEQYMSLAKSASSRVAPEDVFGGNFHCWKESINAYEKAIAAMDTPEARKGLAAAIEMFGVEESALFVRLHNNVDSTIKIGNTSVMAQQLVSINAIKKTISAENKIDPLVEKLNTAIANAEKTKSVDAANAEKLASIEEDIKKSKLDGRKQDTARFIEAALKLVPMRSQKYFQYTNELQSLSKEIKIENPLTPEQSAEIDAKKCVWSITPSAKELTDNGRLLGLKVISVNAGYDAAKTAGNITGVNTPHGFRGTYNIQASTIINSPSDYLENILNKKRELVSSEIEVRNSSQSVLNVDSSNIKFVDQNDNNYDCASLVDLGSNSQVGVLALQPSLKKRLSVMFVVPNDINPKGIRLFFVVFNNQPPRPMGEFEGGRFNNGQFNNGAQENKVQVFSTFDRVEVKGKVLIDKVAVAKPVEKPKPTKTIYLQGGDVLKAVKVNDFNDIYLITDEDGKNRRLEKKDVFKIEDIEDSAADASTGKESILTKVGVLANDRVKIVLKGTGVMKGYIGKIVQVSQTQIMFQKEGENTSIVSIPLDNINEISKFEPGKNDDVMASLDSGNPSGSFFEIADAGIGEKFPVQEKDGQTLFEVHISENNDVHIVVEVKFKDERQNLDIVRDTPMPFQIAGVNYVLLCPTRRHTERGYEKIEPKRPFIIITHAGHDHGHDHDHDHDHNKK